MDWKRYGIISGRDIAVTRFFFFKLWTYIILSIVNVFLFVKIVKTSKY